MIILNKNIKYNFNPFGGLSEGELEQVINPEKHPQTELQLFRDRLFKPITENPYFWKECVIFLHSFFGSLPSYDLNTTTTFWQ